MPWKNATDRKKCWNRIFAAAVLALILLSFLAWPRVWRRYERWSAQRSVGQAKDAYAKGDYEHAMLSVRKALDVNPMDPDACRVAAQVLEASGSPLALRWRSQLDSILPGDPENLLAWGKDAAEADDWATVERVIQTLKPADQNNARYHDIVARLAARKNDVAEAELHWAEAVRLDPREEHCRLNLAGIRLQSKDSDVRARALGVLRELSEKGSQRIQARRVLLQDALNQGDATVAMGLADALVAAPGTIFTDKLLRLSILRLLRDGESASYLGKLREVANADPANLAELLAWMNGNDLAMLVSEWVPTIPRDTVSKPPVSIAVAQAYAKSAEWNKLRAMIENGNWMEMDYLRRAFLARTLERLDEPEESAGEWKTALAAAHSSRDTAQRIERLARVASSWGWDARAEEILWEMAGYDGCPRWALDTLWAAAFKRGDTGKLHKVSVSIVKARPKDRAARNNSVFLSLLTRTEEGNPKQAAAALFKDYPGNPHVAATYALSLHQQGKAAEAVAAMSALKPEELREPQVALYFGIALMAAGQSAKAKEYLELGSAWPLLPEEKALVARVTAATATDAAKPAVAGSDMPGKRSTPEAGAAVGKRKP